MGAKKGMRSADLCRTLDLQPYVLRYWETEFRELQSESATGGQRTYSTADVQLVRRIKQLLYEEGYTIAGARKKLEAEPFDALLESEPAGLFEESVEAEVGERAAEAPAAGADAASDLDSAAQERIEQLRRGIEEALATARSTLKLLEK